MPFTNLINRAAEKLHRDRDGLPEVEPVNYKDVPDDEDASNPELKTREELGEES